MVDVECEDLLQQAVQIVRCQLVQNTACRRSRVFQRMFGAGSWQNKSTIVANTTRVQTERRNKQDKSSNEFLIVIRSSWHLWKARMVFSSPATSRLILYAFSVFSNSLYCDQTGAR